MKTRVRKWGNSLAVRITADLAKDLNLSDGVEVEIAPVNGGLLLRKRKREYTLDELLAQITPENIHRETEW